MKKLLAMILALSMLLSFGSAVAASIPSEAQTILGVSNVTWSSAETDYNNVSKDDESLTSPSSITYEYTIYENTVTRSANENSSNYQADLSFSFDDGQQSLLQM